MGSCHFTEVCGFSIALNTLYCQLPVVIQRILGTNKFLLNYSSYPTLLILLLLTSNKYKLSFTQLIPTVFLSGKPCFLIRLLTELIRNNEMKKAQLPLLCCLVFDTYPPLLPFFPHYSLPTHDLPLLFPDFPPAQICLADPFLYQTRNETGICTFPWFAFQTLSMIGLWKYES